MSPVTAVAWGAALRQAVGVSPGDSVGPGTPEEVEMIVQHRAALDGGVLGEEVAHGLAVVAKDDLGVLMAGRLVPRGQNSSADK